MVNRFSGVQLIPKKYSLGADPEMFAVNGRNSLVPAFTFLPPKEVLEFNKKTGLPCHAVPFWDGFQAEWSVDPDTCLNVFCGDVRNGLQQFNAICKEKGYTPTFQNVFRINPKWFAPEIDEQFIQLGCKPSDNAYKMKGQCMEDGRKLTHRFAGGHMHFGAWDAPPPYEHLVMTLDKICGVWSVGAAANFDNPVRRKYYGLAGEFRTPQYGRDGNNNIRYGLEWRTLSNFWLRHPQVMQATWEIARMAMRWAEMGATDLWASTVEETTRCINTCDVKLARQIIARNEHLFKHLFSEQIQYSSIHETRHVRAMADLAFKMNQEGLEIILPKKETWQDSWYLTPEKGRWMYNAGSSDTRFADLVGAER